MDVADVENPNNPGGGADATPEPDELSQFHLECCLSCSCMACTVLAASAGLVSLFFLSAHAATAVRVLADFGLAVGIVGIGFGAFVCGAVTHICIHGDPEGTRQAEAPGVAA